MTRILTCLLASLAVSICQPGQSEAGLYATGRDDTNNAVLYRINASTGQATAIGTTPNAYLFSGGLAYAAKASSTLYAIGYDMSTPGAFGAYTPALFRIDVTSGAGTRVGYLDPDNVGFLANGGGGLAWDSETDTLYATGCKRRVSGAAENCDSALFTVNAQTGASALVGLAGVDGLHGGGLSFGQDHSYLFSTGWHESGSYSALYRIDRVTGHATLVGTTEPGQGLSYGGLEFDPDMGFLYATGWLTDNQDSKLFHIDPTTGVSTIIGSTGTGNGLAMGGLALVPEPVPEPSVPLMLLVGSVMMCCWARRNNPGPSHADNGAVSLPV